jgi:single-stranded DNA-binding protein
MNQCVLEVEVIDAPTVRYTQDNQTPIAEMSVRFDALRDGDPPSELKVVGWGNLAQELQNRVQVGQRLLIEGRLRMNTVPRGDGMKEKRAEFTLARLHPIGASTTSSSIASSSPHGSQPPSGSARPERPTTIAAPAATPKPSEPEPASWNAAPLVPDTDDIPF